MLRQDDATFYSKTFGKFLNKTKTRRRAASDQTEKKKRKGRKKKN